MKIERIEIDGFGKMVNQTFGPLDDFTIFYGPNESGKSTIADFIAAILFGFPSARKKNTNLYDSRDTSAYGGRLFISGTRYGNITLARYKKGRQKLTMTVSDGQEIILDDTSELLYHLFRDDYFNFFGFSLDDLNELKFKDKDDFNHQLLSLGVSGSGLYQQIMEVSQKNQEGLFKGQGQKPLLNQAMVEVNDLYGQMVDLEDSQTTYQRLSADIRQLEEEKNGLLKERDLLENQAKSSQDMLDRENQIKIYQNLQNEVNRYEFRDFPDQLAEDWYRGENQIKDLEENLIQVTSEKTYVNMQLAQTINNPWIVQYPDKAKVLYQLIKMTEENNNQVDHLKESLAIVRHDEQSLRSDIGLSLKEPLPRALTNDQSQSWQQRVKDYYVSLSETEWLEDRIYTQKDDIKTQKLKLEKAKANLPEEEEVTGLQTGHWMLIALVAVLALGTFALALFTSDNFWWVLGPSLLVISGLLYFVFKGAIGSKQADQDKEVYQLQADVRSLEDQLKQSQVKLQDTHKNLEQGLRLQEDFLNDLEAFAKEQGLSSQANLLAWIEGNQVTELYQLEKKEAQLNRNLEEVYSNYRYNPDDWEGYRQAANLSQENTSEVANHFKAAYQAYLATDNRNQVLQEQIHLLEQEIEELNNKKQALNDQMQATLSQYGFSEGHQLLTAIEEEKEMQDNQHRMDLIRDAFGDQAELLDQAYLTDDYLLQNQQSSKGLEEINAQIDHCNAKISELTYDKKKMEETGLYSQIRQDYTATKSDTYDLGVDYAANKIIEVAMSNAVLSGRQNVLPRTLDATGVFLRELTNYAYQDILVKDNQLYAIRHDGAQFLAHELSLGTKQQLYLALRFAFIQESQTDIDLPILIDDAFVNFDEERRDSLYRILAELSKSRQVIYFTIQPEESLVAYQPTLIDLA